MIEPNNIIVLPYLRGRIADNAVNTSNVAIQNAAEEEVDSRICDEYWNVYNKLNDIISNIHGESQLIELYVQDEEVKVKNNLTNSIDSIKYNCLKLIKILSNMKDLIRIEDQQFDLNINNVNIVEAIEDIVINISNNIKDKKVIFDTNIEEKFMPCDAAKIQKAILILLSNAIKFSDEKEVFVKLHISKDNINLTISFKNRNKDLINLFINKMDNLNKNSIEDISVGFHICKSIMNLHKGHIDLCGIEEEVYFLLQLPCENTDSIFYLYNNDKVPNGEYLTEQIQIEFSDLYEI